MSKKSATARTAAPVPTPVPTETPSATKTPLAASLTGQEFSRLLGDVSWLMSRSPNHKFAFLADLEWLVMPPLVLGQARLYRNEKNDPIAYVSWALVSDEVNERLKSGIARIQPPEWRCGPHPWVIDVVAPFGGAKEALETVQKTVFEGKTVPVLSQRPPVPSSGKKA
jgi:cytolysin-activating lysine-acyltransferase